MVYVAVVIVVVLLLTSETYGEVPVLILTFVVALIVNQGTNYLLGKISFVSNSVTSILQLALSIDYAIIFCNRFKEEHQTLPIREAVIAALSKAIPEIGASCLTTVGGLVAMLFMQFKLGPDMAICLIKSIAFALLSAFLVMPGLLMLFGPLIDRTAHTQLRPEDLLRRQDTTTQRGFIVPAIFLSSVVFGVPALVGNCPYAYGYSLLDHAEAQRDADRGEHDRGQLPSTQHGGPRRARRGLRQGDAASRRSWKATTRSTTPMGLDERRGHGRLYAGRQAHAAAVRRACRTGL